MGLEPTSKTVVKPSTTCEHGTNIETRLHKNSTLIWRSAYGDSTTGEAFECDGLDECLIGEDPTAPEIAEMPECSCTKSGFRNGKKRVRDLDGSIKAYHEPAPRSWCEESAPQSSAGNGPPGASGNTAVLIDGLTLKISSRCYPLQVRPTIEICGWDIYPDDPRDVARYLEWTIYQTAPDSAREQLTKKRCKPLGDKRVGCWDMPAESEFEIVLDAGLQYNRDVDESFDANLAEIKIVADITEITSFDAIETGGC